MQFLFVDESGTPPTPEQSPRQPYFVLGGIVIPEDIWKKLADDLTQIKAHFNITGEIKWRYFSPTTKGKPHSMSHLTGEQKEAVRTALYAAIRKYRSVRIISVVVVTEKAYQSTPYVKTPDDMYWYAYKQLTERFQYYLQDIGRMVGETMNGIVVCDHRGPRDDMRLQELHYQMLFSQDWKTAKYANLVEGLFMAPSHFSVGIQFADMVAGAIYRTYSAKDLRYWNQIQNSFRVSPKGAIEGYGLVLWPKK